MMRVRHVYRARTVYWLYIVSAHSIHVAYSSLIPPLYCSLCSPAPLLSSLLPPSLPPLLPQYTVWSYTQFVLIYSSAAAFLLLFAFVAAASIRLWRQACIGMNMGTLAMVRSGMSSTPVCEGGGVRVVMRSN